MLTHFRRFFADCYLSCLDIFFLWAMRRRIKKAVGADLFCAAPDVEAVAFPSALRPLENIRQSSYAIEKILFLARQKPRQFSPFERADILINWQDLTVDAVATRTYVAESYRFSGLLPFQPLFINSACTDISKNFVGTLNAKIFGYDLNIDPLRHHGAAVEKSNDNHTHDGSIITCPLSPAEVDRDKVYSLLINNMDGDHAVDFRLLYLDGLLDFFFEKRRPEEKRFSSENTSARIRDLSDEFTVDEIEKIETFCREIGADYGELDVLRDRKNGKLYIVDFAKTPGGIPLRFSPSERRHIMVLMTIAYLERFVKPALAAQRRAMDCAVVGKTG